MGDARIPAQVRNQIVAAIIDEVGLGDSHPEVKEIALGSPVTFLRLARSGPQAILVDGMDESLCAGNGNCASWLFRIEGSRATLVFEASGQGIVVLKTFHHGMLDLSTSERLGHHLDVVFEVAQFDGKVYRSAYCYHAITDDDGHTQIGPHGSCK